MADSETLICCENLTKVYHQGQSEIRALDDVSFTIHAGEFVAIVGASGSGKSTLMNMLGGLDQPSSGEVYVDGVALSTLNSRQLAQFRNETVGFVFQQFQLLPKKTALQNVKLPLHYRRPRPDGETKMAEASLARVGLGDRTGHRPTELSGGQQQRVAIARALVGAPRLLLADEPTGALDSVTSADVMRLLQELNGQGLTILLITHDRDVAAYAGRVITFLDGKILSDKMNTTETQRARQR
ncbi:MAG: macrolide ABC transporter ATP-binding protein [Robiginitomaculum sp.]|nr:MAG: macrolide ABC transporter ATP-binding protein [Robiginitomaculum sp.]